MQARAVMRGCGGRRACTRRAPGTKTTADATAAAAAHCALSRARKQLLRHVCVRSCVRARAREPVGQARHLQCVLALVTQPRPPPHHRRGSCFPRRRQEAAAGPRPRVRISGRCGGGGAAFQRGGSRVRGSGSGHHQDAHACVQHGSILPLCYHAARCLAPVAPRAGQDCGVAALAQPRVIQCVYNRI